MTLQAIRAAALISTFSSCLLAAPAVLAQPTPPGFDDDGPAFQERGRGGPPFLRGVDLSEAQQDRVFAILHEQVPARRELEKAEHKAHDALHALSGGVEFDAAAADTQAQALGQAIAGQELLRLRTDAKLMAVLTPEQRAGLRQPRDGKRASELKAPIKAGAKRQ